MQTPARRFQLLQRGDLEIDATKLHPELPEMRGHSHQVQVFQPGFALKIGSVIKYKQVEKKKKINNNKT